MHKMDNNNTLQKIEPTSELIASLDKLGMQVPEGATIVAAQDTPGVMNIVIPKAPGVMALGDNDLDSVAGGIVQGGCSVGFSVPGMSLMGSSLASFGIFPDEDAAFFNMLACTHSDF